VGAGDSFPGGIAAGLKLTTHLHLLPRSRMRGAMRPFHSTSSRRDVR